MKKYKLGILVSNDYNDFSQIKNSIHNAKQVMEDNIEIGQISENNFYSQIKKFVKEIGLDYVDVLKCNESFNTDAHNQNRFIFGHDFNPKYYYIRNSTFIARCDGVFAFITKTLDVSDPVYQILRKVKDKHMNFKIFS